MSFKRTKVVMLSTNQKALIGDFVIGTTIEENPQKLFYGKKVQEPFCVAIKNNKKAHNETKFTLLKKNKTSLK
jgi:hypothetical protein